MLASFLIAVLPYRSRKTVQRRAIDAPASPLAGASFSLLHIPIHTSLLANVRLWLCVDHFEAGPHVRFLAKSGHFWCRGRCPLMTHSGRWRKTDDQAKLA